MEILKAFKDPHIARNLLQRISLFKETVSFMEVCGTHTVAIFRTGIRAGLPENIKLVSGPGCPVCVTPAEVIEQAIGLACSENTVLFCFGDMMRVPGSSDSLESARASRGASVKMMYGPLEALEYAKLNPQHKVVLFGVGFETTIPLFASVIWQAKEEKVKNLYLFSAFKVVPPALKALLSSGDMKVDGFILPGHVSSIIGVDAYNFMADKYGISGVVTGFDLVDILRGIVFLLDMQETGTIAIKNEYSRVVSDKGNKKALERIFQVFKTCTANWRGLGEIPGSGLSLRDDFKDFDAEKLIDFKIEKVIEPVGCKCGEVIKGLCTPLECKLYKVKCKPLSPVGPCMVSSEGTCAAYYKYGS